MTAHMTGESVRSAARHVGVHYGAGATMALLATKNGGGIWEVGPGLFRIASTRNGTVARMCDVSDCPAQAIYRASLDAYLCTHHAAAGTLAADTQVTR